MADLVGVALFLWALWVLCNLALFALSVLLPKPDGWPHFDGFRVVVPPRVRAMLTPAEVGAVVQHEEGHRRRLHVWTNLLRSCLLSPSTPGELWAQELEADDQVENKFALASALRKLSRDPSDLRRADRLEEAGSRPNAGDRRGGTPRLLPRS